MRSEHAADRQGQCYKIDSSISYIANHAPQFCRAASLHTERPTKTMHSILSGRSETSSKNPKSETSLNHRTELPSPQIYDNMRTRSTGPYSNPPKRLVPDQPTPCLHPPKIICFLRCLLISLTGRPRTTAGRGTAVTESAAKCVLPTDCICDQRTSTSFSITNLTNINSTFNEEKQAIVKSIGFGSLLSLIPPIKFPRQLAFWVLRNMKEGTPSVQLGNNIELSFNDFDIELVTGLPKGTKKVNCTLQLPAIDSRRIKKLLLLKPHDDITLQAIESVLTRDYTSKMSMAERDAFKVAFVLCADAYFLAPTGWRPKINQELYKTLLDPSMIPDFNWCGYVKRGLVLSSKRIQQSIAYGNKTVLLDGCLLFPAVSPCYYTTYKHDTTIKIIMQTDHNSFTLCRFSTWTIWILEGTLYLRNCCLGSLTIHTV